MRSRLSIRSLPWIAAVLLLGLAGGCSKKSDASMAPGYAGDMGGYADSDSEEMYAEMEAAPEADYAEMKKMSRNRDDAYPSPEPAAPSAAGGAVPSTTVASPAPSAGKPTPEPAIAEADDQPDDHGRQIIYTANLNVGVYNVQKAMNLAEALPARLGGWVHTRSEGFLTMKIPARHLRAAMDELGALGNVLVRELQAQDVTAEFFDLETRIRVLRETQAQLIELLKKSKNVEEALNVRRALDEVTMQLETSLGRMRQLQSSISFSTLTVTFLEQGPHTDTPTSNDPFPWVDSLGVETTEWR